MCEESQLINAEFIMKYPDKDYNWRCVWAKSNYKYRNVTVV